MTTGDLLLRSLPLLLQGTWMTIRVLSSAACLSILLGTAMGICLCPRLRIPLLSGVVEGIAFVLRAVPFYVQLLMVYFVIPDLLGINLPIFASSVLALGLCSSGYVAQLVRASIGAIPGAQWEAAAVLGYPMHATLWYVIRPQMLPVLLPGLCNELDSLLKSTAILSSIGLLELTRVAQNIIARTLDPVPVYLVIATIYCILSGGLNLLARRMEASLRHAQST